MEIQNNTYKPTRTERERKIEKYNTKTGEEREREKKMINIKP